MLRVAVGALIYLMWYAMPALASGVPAEVLSLSQKVENLGRHPVVVSEVKKLNKIHLSEERIQQIESEWTRTLDSELYIKSLMTGPLHKVLLDFEQSEPYFSEVFVTNKLGYIIALTSPTTDFIQSDEDKWVNSFADGSGAIYFSPVYFDESAFNYLIQISIPVMNGDLAIGVITVGVNMDELGV